MEGLGGLCRCLAWPLPQPLPPCPPLRLLLPRHCDCDPLPLPPSRTCTHCRLTSLPPHLSSTPHLLYTSPPPRLTSSAARGLKKGKTNEEDAEFADEGAPSELSKALQGQIAKKVIVFVLVLLGGESREAKPRSEEALGPI